MTDFADLKPGDSVTRLVSSIPMPMTVVKVEDGLVYCNTAADDGWAAIVAADGHFWTFDVATGVEVDEEIRWGPRYGRTGSRLVR